MCTSFHIRMSVESRFSSQRGVRVFGLNQDSVHRVNRRFPHAEDGGCKELERARRRVLVAEVLVGLATDTTVYLTRRGGDRLTFTIHASDFSWHPGLPGRPPFPSG